MADQLTPFALGCYGNDSVLTPEIDRLSAEGVRFASAYSSSPLCTPARYAFMTGLNVSEIGAYDNAAGLSSTVPTFAHYLRDAGYQTTLAGKMHFVGADQLHGFESRLTTDVYPADFGWVPDWTLDPKERIDLWYHNMSSVKQAGVCGITNQLAYDDEVGYVSQKAIRDFTRSVDERPWCLVTSFIHPHDPYATRQKYWDLYEGRDIPLPKVSLLSDADPHSKRLETVMDLVGADITDEDVLRARRAYYGNVSYVDEWVGKLRETLVECHADDNTVIVFLSDHGDMLGERGLWYKMSFYEWSCRIPLIIHAPGRYQPSVVDTPVAQVDILPTLVELVSGNSTEFIDNPSGKSLIGLCNGDKPEAEYIVSEYLGEGAVSPMLMIRLGSLKYINSGSDPELLYDLESDPNELNNLANESDMVEVIQGFRGHVESHWNVDRVHRNVLADQKRRRFINQCLRKGQYTSWDYAPPRDYANEFTRSHYELSQFDYESRWPRVEPFISNTK